MSASSNREFGAEEVLATITAAPDMVIVGAGQAGRRAAEVLRAHAPAARITLIGEEEVLPYDRPLLSKQALLDEAAEVAAFVKSGSFYASNRISLKLHSRVSGIDRANAAVQLVDGSEVPYSKLLLATGCRPRKLGCHVFEGAPVYYLRTIADARKLRRALHPGARVVILGGGFIGLEVAATATARGCSVTVVEPNQRVLQRAMPELVSSRILELHRNRSVQFILGKCAQSIERAPDTACAVHLDGEVLLADVVIGAIGAQPNVELASGAGLQVDNGIVVDAGCRTDDPHIFAAGDVTSHFNEVLGRHVRLESWQVAENQAPVAASNMVGQNLGYNEIPWVWTDQYDWNVQTLGFFAPSQEQVIRGDVAAGTFCVFSLNSDSREIEAVAAINSGRDIAIARRMMQRKVACDPSRLRDTAIPLAKLLAS